MNPTKKKSQVVTLKVDKEEAVMIETLRLKHYGGISKSDAVRRAIKQVATGAPPLVVVSPGAMKALLVELEKTEKFITEIERARQAVWTHGAAVQEKADRLHAADAKLDRMINEFETAADRVRTLIRMNSATAEIDIGELKKAVQLLRDSLQRLVAERAKATDPKRTAVLDERIKAVRALLRLLAKAGLGDHTDEGPDEKGPSDKT